ncbi:MAG: hypothetical protein ABI456_09755 [Ktedonobacteraceae bacterium]|nr:hypothetical protein [Chloroflexota bacterium]
MSADVLEAFLAYATIPLYVIGLLVLVYIIAHSQLGFSLSEEIKQTVKTELTQERPKAPVSSYLVLFVLFALFTVLAIMNQRRQQV